MAKSKKQPTISKSGFTTSHDRWVFYMILAITVALPLIISRITYDQFDIAKIAALRVLTLAAVVFWAVKMWVSKKREIRWSKLDFLVAGFLLLVLASTINSIHVPTAVFGKFKRYEGLLTFLNYGVIYFLALQTFTGFDKLSKLSKTITFAGALVSLYGVMQYMGMDPLPWATLPFEERRSFSTFGNPDLLAGFLVILVPIAVAEFLRARNTKDNLLMGASVFLALMCLLTAFTRGAWLATAAAMVVFVIIGARAIFSNPKKLAFILTAFVGIFAAIAIYSASSGHSVLNLMERLKSTVQITEGSAASRIEIWKAGLKMVEESPVLGLGPDTYRFGSERYETLKYAQIGHGQTVADNAHNYVIQLAAGVGIPATVMLLLFFVAVIVFSAYHARKAQADERLLLAGFVSAIVGYLIHLLFGVSISGSTGIFWIIIGALVASMPIVKITQISNVGIGSISLKSSAVALTLVTAVMSFYALSMYAGDRNYAQAIQLSSQGDIDGASAKYENAIRLYKNGRYYDGYGIFLERAGIAQNNPDLIKKAVKIYEGGKNLEPLEADHYVFVASAKARLGTSDPKDKMVIEAIKELKDAIKVRPNAFSARVLLGNIYLFQGKYKEAIKELEFALLINPGHDASLQLIAQSYENMGDKKTATEFYKKLLEVSPDNPAAKAGLERVGRE